MAYVVSNLTDYVADNRELITKHAVASEVQMLKYMRLLPDTKGSVNLNFLAAPATFQSGASCGFSASGNATFSKRTLVTAPVKVNESFCPQTLLGKWTEYKVKLDAGLIQQDLPFEEEIIREITSSINEGIDKLIWQGDTSQSSDATIKWIDGILAIASDDGNVITESISSGATAYDAIMQVYMAIPEETIDKGAKIHVSPAIFRAFIRDLVAKNLYHYAGPVNEAPDEFIIPGTNVAVVKTRGLKGSLKIVAASSDNLVYGFDISNAQEHFDLWWSKDNDEFRYKVLFNLGVQYMFSEELVVGTMAAAPAAPTATLEIASATISSASVAATTVSSASVTAATVASMPVTAATVADMTVTEATINQA